MKISIIPPDTVKTSVRVWLMETLNNEKLDNNMRELPTRFYCWVDGYITNVQGSTWSRSRGQFNVGYENVNFPVMEKLAMLVAIAAYIGVKDEAEIVEAINKAFAREVLRGFRSIYDGIIYSNREPQSLAFSPGGDSIACKFDDQWFTPSGAVAAVDDTWIVVQG